MDIYICMAHIYREAEGEISRAAFLLHGRLCFDLKVRYLIGSSRFLATRSSLGLSMGGTAVSDWQVCSF